MAANVRVGNALGAGNIDQAKKSSAISLIVTGTWTLCKGSWCTQAVHGGNLPPPFCDLPIHCDTSSDPLSSELFAVTFCVLLLGCKDLVGYIFTTDW